MASCIICRDAFRVSEGLLCSNGHFTCGDCLNVGPMIRLLVTWKVLLIGFLLSLQGSIKAIEPSQLLRLRGDIR
jgi:hypothetical protein